MIVAELLTELKTILPDQQIIETKHQNHPLGNSGQVTVYPKLEEEISNVLKYANEYGKTIAIVGGGTKRGYGGLIESADILLSLASYKGIIEHVVGDMTLTVKAGTTFKELQDYLAEHKQKVSLDPAWPEYSTIGGIIASNESGPKRLGYGSSRDVVIGLRMIYPDGKVIRSGGKVVKNVAGYDMNKLFIGSMGTLGIASEITLKLRPLAKYQSLILVSFPEGNLEEVGAFAIQLLDSMLEPISLELISPDLAESLTGEKFFTLAISFEDVESSVHYQEDFVRKIQPNNTKLNLLQQQHAHAFWEGFYKQSPNGAAQTPEQDTECSLKIGVKNLDVIKVLKESQLLHDSYNLNIKANGGLGHGLCHVHLRGASQDVMSAIHQLRGLVEGLDGYVIVKHLPYTLRQNINVWGETPSYFFLLEGIKQKVDPGKMLNPKRFVGGI